jgi:hypothetical protein
MDMGGGFGNGWYTKVLLEAVTQPSSMQSFTNVESSRAGPVATANLVYAGFSISDASTTSTDAIVELRHGSLDSNPLLRRIFIAGGSGANESLARPIATPGGIRITIVQGKVNLTVFTNTLWIPAD